MSEPIRIVIAVLIVLVLVGLFITSYLLNKKTPKPEGCQEITSSCSSCEISACSVRHEDYEGEKHV